MRVSLSRARWPILPIAAILLLLTGPVLPVAGQAIEGTTAMVQIDVPSSGTTVNNGQSVQIKGWAADTAGPGTGIAEVHVYLDGQAGQGGTGIGAATYGTSRPDVAQAFGRTDWANTGYELTWTPSGLTGGAHTIYVYARSTSSGWQYKTVSITVNAPTPAAPAPGQGPGGMMPPGPMGPGSGNPYGFTPPANQLGGQGEYGSGFPYGDLYGPSGRPCGAPGYNYPDTYLSGACPPPPPPPPPGYFPPGGPGGIPPVGPSGLVVPAQATPAGTVGLSWAGVPNASEYRVYQASNAFSQQFTLVRSLPQALGSFNTSTTVTGLTPGTTYFFSVRAVVNGTEQPVPVSSTATGGTIGGLPGPLAIQVASVTSNSVTLTWQPLPGAVSYRITQSLANSPVQSGTVLNSTSPNGATIIGLQPSSSYTFYVTARDAFGVEGPPSVIQATTSA
jgi:hypothetical protein